MQYPLGLLHHAVDFGGKTKPGFNKKLAFILKASVKNDLIFNLDFLDSLCTGDSKQSGTEIRIILYVKLQ